MGGLWGLNGWFVGFEWVVCGCWVDEEKLYKMLSRLGETLNM